VSIELVEVCRVETSKVFFFLKVDEVVRQVDLNELVFSSFIGSLPGFSLRQAEGPFLVVTLEMLALSYVDGSSAEAIDR